MTAPIRRVPLVMLIGLAVQFLLRMAVNLFVTLPDDHPGSKAPEYFGGVVQSVTRAILHGPVLLVLHAAFGLLLVVGAAMLFVQAIRSGARSFAIESGVGPFAVLAAGSTAAAFSTTTGTSAR